MRPIVTIALAGLLMGQTYCPPPPDPVIPPGLICDSAVVPEAMSALYNATPSDNRRSTIRLGGAQGASCSSTVLSPRTIITASHCYLYPDNTWDVFDKSASYGAAKVATTVKFRQHPDTASHFTVPNAYDLQLLYTDVDLPPPYAAFPFTEFMGPMCTGLLSQGYGMQSTGGPTGELYEGSYAIEIEGPASVQGISVDGSGPCAGDSGGPLYAMTGGTPWLLGVMSRGACEGGWGIWSRIDTELDWIRDGIRWSDANEEGVLAASDIPVVPSNHLFWVSGDSNPSAPNYTFDGDRICYQPHGTEVTCDPTNGPGISMQPFHWMATADSPSTSDARVHVRARYRNYAYLSKQFEERGPVYVFGEYQFPARIDDGSAGSQVSIMDLSFSSDELPVPTTELDRAVALTFENTYPANGSMKLWFDWSGLRGAGAATADSAVSTAAVPVGSYSEIEVRYVRSSGGGATDGSIHLYIDNVEVIAQTGIETWVSGYPRFNASYGIYGFMLHLPDPTTFDFRTMGIANYQLSNGTVGDVL